MKLFLIQPELKAFENNHNLTAIRTIVEEMTGPGRPAPAPGDILLLPEHFTFSHDRGEYDSFVAALAKRAGCTVVGGSHHRSLDGRKVNYGAVVGSGGTTIGTYEKLRPYFNEQDHVVPGRATGEMRVGQWNVLVLICADFWYSDLILSVNSVPDLILVPALSVSRKDDPEYSRSLWRNLAVTRAYEFGAYVGISDWSADSTLPKYRTCGAGGFADPTTLLPGDFFTPVKGNRWSVFDLDRRKIEAFREDRRMRGFFWK